MTLLTTLVSPVPHFALGAVVGALGEEYYSEPEMLSTHMALASGALGASYGLTGRFLLGTSWLNTARNTVACGLGYAAGHAVYRFFR